MLNPEEIKLFSIVNTSGAEVILSNLGAGIVSIVVPDKNGVMADVALGYRNPEEYFGDGPYMGKTPGRFSNRIAQGKFSIGERHYSLLLNNGPNHLHGGPDEQSYANRIWDAREVEEGILFSLDSPDGDAGYPGNLHVEVLYSWSDSNSLTIKLTAVTDAETVVNLTNHAYFNLKGEEKGDVTGHKLKLYASRWLVTDQYLTPTGEMASVKGTPMDFTTPKALGKDLKSDFPAISYGKGYDNCFVIDDYRPGVVRPVAELYEETSGRKLVVSSDSPGIQVYTGNWLSGSPVSKSGRPYDDYDGVALECQQMPDGPNHPEFPFTTLKKGETYTNTIVYAFE